MMELRPKAQDLTFAVTVSGSQNYVHIPLPDDDEDWIRLIHLLPGEAHDPIVCRLEIVSLELNPAYEAISYCWGDPEVVAPIDCGSGTLNVTTNLKDALHALRNTSHERVLWADAISINQSDLAERGRQVRFMARIYQRADMVISWLGSDSDGTAEIACNLITKVCDILYAFRDNYGNAYLVPQLSTEYIENVDPAAWTALSRLLSRPYFTRVWIVQEIGISSHCVLQFGNSSVTKRQLMNCVWFLLRAAGPLCDRFDLRCKWYKLWSLYDEDKSRYDFLELFKDAKEICSATDPRDYIYAFLGHPSSRRIYSENQSGLIITPDYSKSLLDVYTDLATTMFMRGDMEVLSIAGLAQDSPYQGDSWPSWVPPYWVHRPNSERSVGISSFHHPPLLKAGTSMTDRKREVLSGRRLVLSGLTIGTVQWRSSRFRLQDLNPKEADSMQTDAQSDVESESDTESNDPWEDVRRLLQSLQGTTTVDKDLRDELALAVRFYIWSDTMLGGSRLLATERMKELRLAFSNLAISPPLFEGDQVNQDESITRTETQDLLTNTSQSTIMQLAPPVSREEATRKSVVVSMTAWNRRLFYTDRGSFGLGPSVMQENDICCVLFGAHLPYILRRTDKSDHYSLIGECCLPGIMEGEAIERMQRGELNEQEFIIV